MEKLKAALPLNFELLGNPLNWVVVLLMVAVAGAAIAFLIPTTMTPLE